MSRGAHPKGPSHGAPGERPQAPRSAPGLAARDAQVGPPNSPEPYCRDAMSTTGFWTPKAVMKMLTTTMMKTRPVARLLRKSSLACFAGLLRSYLTVGKRARLHRRLPALRPALRPSGAAGPTCLPEKHAYFNTRPTMGLPWEAGWLEAQKGPGAYGHGIGAWGHHPKPHPAILTHAQHPVFMPRRPSRPLRPQSQEEGQPWHRGVPGPDPHLGAQGCGGQDHHLVLQTTIRTRGHMAGTQCQL